MREKICETCGELTPADAEFCLSCGAYQRWWDGDGRTRPAPAAGPTPAADPGTAREQPHGPAADASTTAPLPINAVVDPTAFAGPAAATPACPRCRTGNPAGRFFCRRCGHTLRTAGAGAPRVRPADRPSPRWRRLGPTRSAAEREALRAYRRSLPVRYRLFRAGGVLGLVALLLAGYAVTGGRPAAFALDRWDDLRGTLVPVGPATATTAPPDAELSEYEAAKAVDGSPRTAWATVWRAGTVPALVIGDTGCRSTATTAALLLTLPRAAPVRAVAVTPGLPQDDPERVLQWRPKLLELRFPDGRCQSVTVPDRGVPVVLELERVVSASTVRVDVVDAYQPQGGAADRIAISEIELQQRPPR